MGVNIVLDVEGKQCRSQDIETGCLKLAVVKFWGVQIFKGDQNILIFQPYGISMYKFIKIRHDIIKQCHGNYKEMKKFNYKLEIEIFKNSTLKKFGVLFKSLGVQKGTQTPYWLRQRREIVGKPGSLSSGSQVTCCPVLTS